MAYYVGIAFTTFFFLLIPWHGILVYTTQTSSCFPSVFRNMQPYIIHFFKCLCLTCWFIVELFFVGFFLSFSPYTLVLLQQLCMFCVLHLLLTVFTCFVSVFFCSDSSNHKHVIRYWNLKKILHYFRQNILFQVLKKQKKLLLPISILSHGFALHKANTQAITAYF